MFRPLVTPRCAGDPQPSIFFPIRLYRIFSHAYPLKAFVAPQNQHWLTSLHSVCLPQALHNWDPNPPPSFFPPYWHSPLHHD